MKGYRISHKGFKHYFSISPLVFVKFSKKYFFFANTYKQKKLLMKKIARWRKNLWILLLCLFSDTFFFLIFSTLSQVFYNILLESTHICIKKSNWFWIKWSHILQNRLIVVEFMKFMKWWQWFSECTSQKIGIKLTTFVNQTCILESFCLTDKKICHNSYNSGLIENRMKFGISSLILCLFREFSNLFPIKFIYFYKFLKKKILN